MSTKERFGTLVWRSLNELHAKHMKAEDVWITVGEVASDVDISKATARKYLEELWKMNHATRAVVGTAVGYRPADLKADLS